MKISVIGAGYVGLVTSVCLAEKGHQVICVDMDQEKVDKINNGTPPIFEKGLEELLQRNIRKTLHATTDLPEAVLSTQITFIAVGTPFDGHKIDLFQVEEVARHIGQVLKEKNTYHLVVVKSTVVPCTTDETVGPILEVNSGKRLGEDFGLGMNPEFLTEGVAINDFMFPDRIVLGANDQSSLSMMEEVYTPFEGATIFRTNIKTAEMIKYASNALLATMISFSNEFGNLCAALGDIDVVDVMRGVHLSNYLSTPMPDGERFFAPITSFLMAGCGFGGSCLPKDVNALITHGKNAGRSMELLQAVININEQQPKEIISILKKHFRSLVGIRVAILGLAFKPDTADMRESPAIPVIKTLLEEKAMVQAYDPVARQEAKKLLGDRITYCENLDQVVNDAEAVILITRWEEFRMIPELLAKIKPSPLFIDGRRMLDKSSIPEYEGIGLRVSGR
jgi:UDPglucose 6-dehydrogenase